LAFSFLFLLSQHPWDPAFVISPLFSCN
jgi:hypothetical protein